MAARKTMNQNHSRQGRWPAQTSEVSTLILSRTKMCVRQKTVVKMVMSYRNFSIFPIKMVFNEAFPNFSIIFDQIWSLLATGFVDVVR